MSKSAISLKPTNSNRISFTIMDRVRLPGGSTLYRPLKQIQSDEYVNTKTAAQILELSQRRVIDLLQENIVFQEGRDWKRNPAGSGLGQYRIKLRSILAHAGLDEA